MPLLLQLQLQPLAHGKSCVKRRRMMRMRMCFLCLQNRTYIRTEKNNVCICSIRICTHSFLFGIYNIHVHDQLASSFLFLYNIRSKKYNAKCWTLNIFLLSTYSILHSEKRKWNMEMKERCRSFFGEHNINWIIRNTLDTRLLDTFRLYNSFVHCACI